MVNYWDRLGPELDALKMTRQQFADAIGVSYQAVKKVADGGALGSTNNLRAAQVLKVNPLWLATGKGPKNPAEPMQGYTPLPAPGGGTVSLDAAIAVLADAIERSPYKGQDNLLGMLAYMGKSPGDEINRQSIAALLQNKQQPDARCRYLLTWWRDISWM